MPPQYHVYWRTPDGDVHLGDTVTYQDAISVLQHYNYGYIARNQQIVYKKNIA